MHVLLFLFSCACTEQRKFLTYEWSSEQLVLACVLCRHGTTMSLTPNAKNAGINVPGSWSCCSDQCAKNLSNILIFALEVELSEGNNSMHWLCMSYLLSCTHHASIFSLIALSLNARYTCLQRVVLVVSILWDRFWIYLHWFSKHTYAFNVFLHLCFLQCTCVSNFIYVQHILSKCLHCICTDSNMLELCTVCEVVE